MPISEEEDAIKNLPPTYQTLSASSPRPVEAQYVELYDFSVYRPNDSSGQGFNLITLDQLQKYGARGCSEFRFDGTISVSGRQCYLQDVPFRTLTVDGYGTNDGAATIDLHLYVQSPAAETSNVWYRLGRPSKVYQRFHKPFLWLATFTKLFLDYLDAQSTTISGHSDSMTYEHSGISLKHFGARFLHYLHSIYDGSAAFYHWHGECGYKKDFRTTVAAHKQYLWKECSGIDDAGILSKHPVWREIMAIEPSMIPRQPGSYSQTVVTPYAYSCFKHMYFGSHLQRMEPPVMVFDSMDQRKRSFKLTSPNSSPTSAPTSNSFISRFGHQHVRKGDVVYLKPRNKDRWRKSSDQWLAYVQDVQEHGLALLWLYEPKDTTLGNAFYPFENELFLSDHCQCGKEAWPREDVIGTVDISWNATDPASVRRYFVRQKFRTNEAEDEYDFTSLEQSDFACRCRDTFDDFKDRVRQYKSGDTVLIRTGDLLHPSQIIRFETIGRRVLLRKMLLCAHSSARPNEITITDDTFLLPAQRIIRQCHVGVFESNKDVCFPFDRDGAGDFYYCLSTSESVIRRGLPPLPSAWTNRSRKPPLVGMGIFCGGGNFDRGLEEGGAVDFRYAVDWASHALHSYRANLPSDKDSEDDVHFFLGSVNDYLARSLSGSSDGKVAQVGDISVISAGSPCPGFSRMQPDRQSEESKRNASMVASVVSFVDFYSPLYLILENVPSMADSMSVDGVDQNVFAQIIAALVGLGYQVQQHLMEAWSYGSAQQRSRLFIIATAPSIAPFEPPVHTHGHPSTCRTAKGTIRRRRLGLSSNGRGFGLRKDCFTPFPHKPALAVVRDLPHVFDGQVQICPAFPDHRLASLESHLSRQRMARIPTQPRGLGLHDAVESGLITSGEAFEFHQRKQGSGRAKPWAMGGKSRAYARVYPDRLFPTIVTAMVAQDFKNGRYMHWDEPRLLTVLETRRAQGFPDEEVLVGTPTQQAQIVGNSVDRKVAFSLGLALRASWLASGPHH